MLEEEFLNFTANEFQLNKNSISLSTEFREINSWSSLNALVYISSIHDSYSVLISSEKLAKSRTLRDIYNIITSSN